MVHAEGNRETRLSTKIALSLLIVALLGAVIGYGTWSAFSDTTSNSDNQFSTGTVTIEDDDSDAAMLALTNAAPDDSDLACIIVTYTGSIASNQINMYATTTGSGLDAYLNLTVTRGQKTNPDPFDGCGDFVEDDLIGDTDVVFDDTLDNFPADYATGLAEAADWTTDESHAYQFLISVEDDDNAEGLDATTEFTWEARST